MTPRRRALLALVVVAAIGGLVASLAGGGGDDESSPTPDTVDTAPETAVESSAAATWALIDAVPAHQKSGVFVRAGLDYEPLLDGDLSQERARLTLTAPAAMIAMAPERQGLVPFDRIELAGLETSIDDLETWLFVIVDDFALTVFAPGEDLERCREQFAGEAPFADFGLVGDIEGRFAVSSSDCRELASQVALTGELGSAESVVSAFGALFVAPVEEVDSAEPLTLTWLALADSSEAIGDDVGPLTIKVLNVDLALAARTEDTADDGALTELQILGSGGERETIMAGDDGSFLLDVSRLPARIKIWFDDYGRQHYVRQGPWIDTTSLSRDLEIDLAPEFEPIEANPPASGQNRRPHELRIWRGATSMEVQEYEGLNFTNSQGLADRDRSVDNPNDCYRAAFLGGSYVEAVQTRVDQKAGVIAEALLSTRNDRCVEVFTVGQSLFTVESHYANVVSLIEEQGIDHLIFSVSSLELCRMDDLVYESINGVARDTPLSWRYVDGQFVEPVRRSDAVVVDLGPDFDRREHCAFAPGREDLSVEEAVIGKLSALADEFASFDPDVEVSYFLMKDGYADSATRFERLELITSMCDEIDVRCLSFPPPELLKPETLQSDFSPYLYRYAGDGHPNERANQATAEALAAIVELLLIPT